MYTATSESYLPLSYTWSNATRSIVTGTPRTRCKHATCIHGNHVYVHGGRDGSISLKDFWRYDVESGHWEEVSFRGDSLPHLEGHSMVAHKRLLYIFGGEFGHASEDTPFWILNADLGHTRRVWSEAGDIVPAGRRNHTAVIHNNVMYLYGGYIDLKGSSAELWAFYLDAEEWQLISESDKNGSNSPGGRHDHSAVIYTDQMWVYGGMTDLAARADLWKWNINASRWQRVKYKVGPPPLTGHTACVIDDTMLLYGGETQGELRNELWSLNLTSCIWTKITCTVTPPLTRHTAVSVVIRNGVNTDPNRTHSLPHLRKPHIVRVQNMQRPRSSPPRVKGTTPNAHNHNAKGIIERQRSKKKQDDVFEMKTLQPVRSVPDDESRTDAVSEIAITRDKSPLLFDSEENSNTENVNNDGILNPSFRNSGELSIFNNFENFINQQPVLTNSYGYDFEQSNLSRKNNGEFIYSASMHNSNQNARTSNVNNSKNLISADKNDHQLANTSLINSPGIAHMTSINGMYEVHPIYGDNNHSNRDLHITSQGPVILNSYNMAMRQSDVFKDGSTVKKALLMPRGKDIPIPGLVQSCAEGNKFEDISEKCPPHSCQTNDFLYLEDLETGVRTSLPNFSTHGQRISNMAPHSCRTVSDNTLCNACHQKDIFDNRKDAYKIHERDAGLSMLEQAKGRTIELTPVSDKDTNVSGKMSGSKSFPNSFRNDESLIDHDEAVVRSLADNLNRQPSGEIIEMDVMDEKTHADKQRNCYMLIIGGKDSKRRTFKMCPLSVWKCDLVPS